MSLHALVVHRPLGIDDLLDRVGGPEDGALSLFLGTVRNHHEGRSVRGIRYEAYEEMAREVLEEIVREAARATGVERVAALHRLGELEVGEVSVAIGASSPHRDEAYRATRAVIEAIKVRLPVWKKELYVDGTEGWLPGRDPREAGSVPGEAGTS